MNGAKENTAVGNAMPLDSKLEVRIPDIGVLRVCGLSVEYGRAYVVLRSRRVAGMRRAVIAMVCAYGSVLDHWIRLGMMKSEMSNFIQDPLMRFTVCLSSGKRFSLDAME